MPNDADKIAALELDNARLRAAYESATKSQLSREDLKSMTSLEVGRARRDGRLRDIMALPDHREPPNNRDWRPSSK